MKCDKCGFISNSNFYRCPYCGHEHKKDFEGIRTRVQLGKEFSAQVRTIIIILVVNLFLISVLVDWFLDFKYAITLWSYFILFGSLTVVDIASKKKVNPITALEKMDIFMLGYLILCIALCRIEPVFDARMFFPSLIIPAYLIFTAILSSFIFLSRKKNGVRPIWTETLYAFHLIIASVLFAFLLANKYSIQGGHAAPFRFLAFIDNNGNAIQGANTLITVSEILIYAAFGLSLIYLINYNILLVGYIYRRVKNIYGGERERD